MNVVTDDAGARARHARAPVGRAPRAATLDEVAGDPRRVVDELWRPIAAEQLERRAAGSRPTHGLLALPGVSRRAAACSARCRACSTTAEAGRRAGAYPKTLRTSGS